MHWTQKDAPEISVLCEYRGEAMVSFNLFEKLINEHGSASILKEHLALVRAEYKALERKNTDLQAENESQKHELNQNNSRINSLQNELKSIKSIYVCDHCGSPDLKRTGNKPDPTFGDMGVKQKVFTCNLCGKESAFTPE